MSDISEFQPDIAVTSSRLEEDALAGLQVLLELRTLQTSPRVIMLLDDDQSELGDRVVSQWCTRNLLPNGNTAPTTQVYPVRVYGSDLG